MLFAMFMYGLLAFGMHGLIAWIDRKIAAARNEYIWQSSATPATGQDVVTIPAAAPPAPSAVPAATATPPGPPAAPGDAPNDRR
jgi:predicted lipid-binding transport protein (Tim44 family)